MTHEHEPIPVPSYKPILRAYQSMVESFLADPAEAQLERIRTQEERLHQELSKPGLFALGRLLETPGARDTLAASLHVPAEFILRHMHGDWGELGPEDVQENVNALRHGSRLFSSYRTRRDDKLWIITEWDRSVTTVLLPEEY